MELIEGAGHAAHLERPDAFHALVLDFLRQRYSAIGTTEAALGSRGDR
jgi:hypothetical protein